MTNLERLILTALLLMVSTACHADWRGRRADLGEVHRVAEFRIFYSMSGKDALRSSADLNRNGTSDYVERIARELEAASTTFTREFGLMHPLSSPRYAGRAEFIDVNLLGFPLSEGGPQNGIAYDEINVFRRPVDSGRALKVLVIDLSNNIGANNQTVRHELFHLYQNGYTLFKNRWFTEGTARWIEDLSRKSETGRVPRSIQDVQKLFEQTYDAADFWREVGQRVDGGRDGRVFIRALLEELDRNDASAGLVPGTASERDQKSEANNKWIWKALHTTLRRPEFRDVQEDDIQRLLKLQL